MFPSPVRHALRSAALLLIGINAASADNFDEFADDFSPTHFSVSRFGLTMIVKGELEVGLHDLEGSGGPGNDSQTDTRTLGTRSPHVQLDSFWLALRLQLPFSLGVNTILSFNPDRAGVNAAWFDFRHSWPGWWEHHIELGLHTPMIKIDRRSQRYPLIGSIYWRNSELHALYEGRFKLGANTLFEVSTSIAMVRPLTFSGVAESRSLSGTINVLSYGNARPFSGNGSLFGLRLHFNTHGAFITAFGFIGELAAEAGTDVLRNNFSAYQDLPGYNAVNLLDQDRTLRWAGARAGYWGKRLRVFGELIASQESLVRRWGFYLQGSYVIPLRAPTELFHSLEPLFRYEQYRLLDTTVVRANNRAFRSPAPSQAITWDFEIYTASLGLMVFRNVLRIRLEYYWINESNGVPALGIADQAIRNNELLAQVELRF